MSTTDDHNAQEQLHVLQADDHRTNGNRHYESPPQPLDEALTLCAMLGDGQLRGAGDVRVAIAHGVRTINIRPATVARPGGRGSR